MVNKVDTTKRLLVTLLRSLAVIYGLVANVTRESTEKEIRAAYKKVSRKAHPDQGGALEHQQALNAARDAWEEALAARKRHGGPRKANKPPGKPASSGLLVHVERHVSSGFRFQGEGVLLTYQKFPDTGCWQPFLGHVKTRLVVWKVKFWCATMETNDDGTYHLHMMLQFYKAQERQAQTFAFSGVRPNASSNDLLGEGFCKKKMQQSLDRGFLYVWANKVGTVRGAGGELLVAGNYEPAWTKARCTYTVVGSFLDKLFKAYKLSEQVYEEYVYLARDGVPYRKRNLDECKEKARELRMERDVAERVARIRSNPAIYQPFKAMPEAQVWLQLFQEDQGLS
jgi:curved DNA-binding protein CbpA